MKKLIALMIFVCLGIGVKAQKRNEVALVISPLKFKDAASYRALYRHGLKNENLSLRGGVRVLINTNKEIRSDTLSTRSGTVQYDLSAGVQYKLPISSLDKIYLYGASDAYFNSEFDQKAYETYYGYYWSFGVKPIFGLSYEPFDNIRLSLESRGDFNINLQDYSAPGENRDQRFNFNPANQLALGFGYLF
ncbi:MAG TPA: hypothetical protein DEQ56_06595 [Bacteroidetes bacterium]|jgi:hypothetical protein|nr:hypothetical protein [Bacteroidota bacterium]